MAENGKYQHMGAPPRKKVHTGRHDVDTRDGTGLACSMRAIMPLSMARFDLLSLWADEALFPPNSGVAACLHEGWIRGRRHNVIVVG